MSEALRYCSPIKATRREVRSDLALASGETLRRGDRVSFVHAALNLDADAFSHPTRCDVGAACNLVRPRCNLVRPRCNRCAQV